MIPSDFESVDQPEHYALSAMECIDAMAAMSQIAAFKYLWRMNKKNKTSVEDKLKAVWYLRYSMGDDPRADSNIRQSAALDKAKGTAGTITTADHKDSYDASGPIERSWFKP